MIAGQGIMEIVECRLILQGQWPFIDGRRHQEFSLTGRFTGNGIGEP